MEEKEKEELLGSAKQLEQMRDYLNKLKSKLEAGGLSDLNIAQMKESIYKRREGRIEEMRKALETFKAEGGEAIIRAAKKKALMDRLKGVSDTVDAGLGKCEYTWNKFVAMYFRYSDPSNVTNPDPIRGKLVGTFRSIQDFTAWLMSEEVRYAGFWQGVIRDFANNFFGVINGVYAKLWVPETSPLSDYGIPEVTKEYTDASETTTRDIPVCFAFRHICFLRNEGVWVDIAPYPHNGPFQPTRCAVIYSLSTLEALCSTHDTGTDSGLYWMKYNTLKQKELTPTTVNNPTDGQVWKWGQDEDFISLQFYYWQEEGDDRNSFVSASSQVLPTASATPTSRTWQVYPFWEMYKQDYDSYSYSNTFALWSIAKVGYPMPNNTWKIIGVNRWYEEWSSFLPTDNKVTEVEDDGRHEGKTWGTRKPFSDYGLSSPPDNISALHLMYTYMDGHGMDGVPEPGFGYDFLQEGVGFGFHFFVPITYAWYHPANFTMHSMLLSKDPGVQERYIIRRMGSFSMVQENLELAPLGPRDDNWDAFDRTGDTWMVPYTYSLGSKQIGPSPDPNRKPYHWSDVHLVFAFHPDTGSAAFKAASVSEWIPFPPGTLQEEIFVFTNFISSSRCYWMQKKMEYDSTNNRFRIKLYLRIRQHVAPSTVIVNFTYLLLWKIGRPDPNPVPLQVGMEHPTCDLHYGPGEAWIKEQLEKKQNNT